MSGAFSPPPGAAGHARAAMRHLGDAASMAGTGRADDVPAVLSRGEHVIPADVVSILGEGHGPAGAARLDAFIAALRAHQKAHGPQGTPGHARAMGAFPTPPQPGLPLPARMGVTADMAQGAFGRGK